MKTNSLSVGLSVQKLTLLEHEVRTSAGGKRCGWWLCRCECGTERWMREDSVKRSVSCGCHRRSSRTHGMSDTPEYVTWAHMVERCESVSCHAFSSYGGRGIAVCLRWRNSFPAFFEDMGPRPSLNHSIERINNDGNYKPGNCIWASAMEQQRNRRVTHNITALGGTKCLADWAVHSGIPASTISDRLSRGWPADRAVSEPPSRYVRLLARDERLKDLFEIRELRSA